MTGYEVASGMAAAFLFGVLVTLMWPRKRPRK